MSFPFPEIERRIFSWTFLKDVSLVFEFQLSPERVNPEALAILFKNVFSFEGIAFNNIEKGLSIQNGDKNIFFGFNRNNLTLKLRFPLYKEFGTALEWLPFIQKYLETLGVGELNQLSIVKYNELEYTLKSNNVDVSLAMREIFSKNLLDEVYETDSKTFSSLNRWERKKSIEDQDTQSRVNISYGFCEKDGTANTGALTLKTVVSTLAQSINVSELRERLNEMNHIIDRAFRWCVSDSIIMQMQGKQ
mgnify:CR=1 FL=1